MVSASSSEYAGHKSLIIIIAVELRLGVDLCHPHRCPCGAKAGRMPRHQALNDLIWRALTNAGVPSTKEPKCHGLMSNVLMA